MIKHVIWDWNGTIVNDAPLFVEIMNQSLDAALLPNITLDDYKNLFVFPVVDFWRKLGFKFNDKAFDKMNSRFINNYKKKMLLPKLHNNIQDVFIHLAKLNIKQYVVSASEHQILKKCTNYYRVSSYFNDIVGVDNLNALGKEGVAKKLIDRHSINVKNCLFVGDTPHDADVAQSLGANALLVSYGHIAKSRLYKTNCNIVDSVDDVLSYIINGANK